MAIRKYRHSNSFLTDVQYGLSHAVKFHGRVTSVRIGIVGADAYMYWYIFISSARSHEREMKRLNT